MIKTIYKTQYKKGQIDKLYALRKLGTINVSATLLNRYYSHIQKGGYGFEELTEKDKIIEKQLDELLPLIFEENYEKANDKIQRFMEETPKGWRFKNNECS